MTANTRWAKYVLANLAKISNWIIKLATGTAIAAIACSDSFQEKSRRQLSKIVPELASILMRLQTSPILNCQLHTATNNQTQVFKSPALLKPAYNPANTGALIEE